jgi:hypothetical protein
MPCRRPVVVVGPRAAGLHRLCGGCRNCEGATGACCAQCARSTPMAPACRAAPRPCNLVKANPRGSQRGACKLINRLRQGALHQPCLPMAARQRRRPAVALSYMTNQHPACCSEAATCPGHVRGPRGPPAPAHGLQQSQALMRKHQASSVCTHVPGTAQGLPGVGAGVAGLQTQARRRTPGATPPSSHLGPPRARRAPTLGLAGWSPRASAASGALHASDRRACKGAGQEPPVSTINHAARPPRLLLGPDGGRCTQSRQRLHHPVA